MIKGDKREFSYKRKYMVSGKILILSSEFRSNLLFEDISEITRLYEELSIVRATNKCYSSILNNVSLKIKLYSKF